MIKPSSYTGVVGDTGAGGEDPTALHPGDNVSALTNDAGFITSAPVDSVAGKTGAVTLVKADITDFTEAAYATAAQGSLADTALQAGTNISLLANDAGYITSVDVAADLITSVDGRIGDVTLNDLYAPLTHTHVKTDITDFSDADYATAAQGALADTAVQPAELQTGLDGKISTTLAEGFILMGDVTNTATPIDFYNLALPVYIEAQSAVNLTKGQAVYVSGTAVSGKPEVSLADSSNAATMPAIGLVRDTVTAGNDVFVVASGVLEHVDTSAYTAGQALYINGSGVLTATKPTGTGLIQKVGLVGRSHLTAGTILVQGAGRTNDVPNIPEGYVWIGDAQGVAQTQALSSLTVQSVDGRTGVVTLNDLYAQTAHSHVKADITDFADSDYATAAQGALADSALQAGDNVSALINDAGYLTSTVWHPTQTTLSDYTNINTLIYAGSLSEVRAFPAGIDSKLIGAIPLYNGGHAYDGSDIEVVIDWALFNPPGAGQIVRWEVDYYFSGTGDTPYVAAPITNSIQVDVTGGTINTQLTNSFPLLSGAAGKSILHIGIRRLGTSDTYASDAILYGITFKRV